MNIHTLQKFIEDYKKVLTASALQDLQNISTSLTRSVQAITQRQVNIPVPTKFEIDSYLETFTKLFYQLEKMKSHMALLLPEYDFDVIESGLDQLRSLDEADFELNEKIVTLKDVVYSLNQMVVELNNEVDSVRSFIDPYLEMEDLEKSEEALVSVIFNDEKTTNSLKEFQKNLAKWSIYLPIYQNLVTGQSPSELELVSVQNGCIDVVLNVDVDVALELTEVFQTAIKSFIAYMMYKKQLSASSSSVESDEVKTIMGELLEAKERDIYITTETIIKEQSTTSKSAESYEKKVKEISELVTTHVIKGNEYEILHLPDSLDTSEDDEVTEETKSINFLRVNTKECLELRKDLSTDDQQKLLTHYKNSTLIKKTSAKKVAKKAARKTSVTKPE